MPSNLSADMHVSNGYMIPEKDSVFDSLISTQVLEHVEDTDLVIEEWIRVIAPKGYLVITVPFMFGVHGLPYDFRRFTTQGLIKKLIVKSLIL